MGISVIIPAFNEEKNLKVLLPSLKSILKKMNTSYELIVVDAKASSDNSQGICALHSAEYVKQSSYGYGNAFREGIRKSTYEYILVVDSDNSQDISRIPQMYDAIKKGAELVIGSRYVKGGKTDDPISSVIMSRLLNFCYRAFLGFRQKDISTDFRIYSASMLKSIETRCLNFDVVEETLFLLINKYPRIKIEEIPISYSKRLEGASKRKLFTFIKDYIKLLFRLKTMRKGEKK